jgi:uncharacterized protein involved in exopolysaccharide biosynthesis
MGQLKNTRAKVSFKRHLVYFVLYLIAGNALGVFYYVVSPKYYRATAAILKPIGSLETLEMSQSGKTEQKTDTSSELFLSILNSRRMFDELIETFNLQSVYGIKNTDRVREILHQSCSIKQEGNRVISIKVIDRDPKRAAAMANFFWQNLDKLLQELTITTAKKNRLFIEERLAATTRTLEDLQTRLNALQSSNKFIAIRETGEISELATQLMNKLAEKKLELEKARRIYQEGQNEIVMLKEEIRDLQKELDLLIRYQKDLSQLLREIKTQEASYTFLTGQLEEAKLTESKDTPFVQVLDKAVAPEQVYAPNLKLILMVITIAVVGIGVLVLFLDILKFLGSI